jgi:F-type H+-transporting ATPase subunit delta
MKEQIVSKVYAQSLIELGEEQKVDIAKEMTTFNELINSNNNLESLLFLESFTVEEKLAVVSEVLNKMNASSVLKNVVSFLITEKRIGLLPLIFKELIVIDDHKKGFMRGTIQGADDQVEAGFFEKINSYLKEKLGREVKLEYIKTPNLVAGYRVTVEDLQLDATLDNQLTKFKNSVLNA